MFVLILNCLTMHIILWMKQRERRRRGGVGGVRGKKRETQRQADRKRRGDGWSGVGGGKRVEKKRVGKGESLSVQPSTHTYIWCIFLFAIVPACSSARVACAYVGANYVCVRTCAWACVLPWGAHIDLQKTDIGSFTTFLVLSSRLWKELRTTPHSTWTSWMPFSLHKNKLVSKLPVFLQS